MTELPFTLLLTSCYKYYETTIPPLLEALKEQDISLSSVILIIGQWPEGVLIPTEFFGIATYICPYSFEAATGLVYLANNPSIPCKPWIFSQQDTTGCADDYRTKIMTFFEDHVLPRSTQYDVFKLCDKFSLSIGFFRREALQEISVAAGLKSNVVYEVTLINIKRLKSWCEDVVFSYFDVARIQHIGKYEDPSYRRQLGFFCYTDDGPSRLVELYTTLGMIKYKSWFGYDVEVKEDEYGKEYMDILIGV